MKESGPSEIMPELSYKLVAQDADWGDGDGTKLEPGHLLRVSD